MKILVVLCFLGVALAAKPEVKKTCTEKPETGICMAAFRMWYYDTETLSCKRFIYGGCQGNGNRYWKEEECLENCKGVTAEPEFHSTHSDVDCNALPEVGPCFALIPRYFYDPLDAQCKKFMYGGCGGNSNNFKTEEKCNEKCAGSKDVFGAIPMPFTCECISGSCNCCGHMKISMIRLDKTVCVEVGYDEEIKANNPPLVCTVMPPMTMFADVCFDFYDIEVSRENIHYCLNVKPRLLKKEVTDWKVGCFDFNKGAESE